MLAQEQAMNKSPAHHSHCAKRICWKAIFAGGLVGFGLTFLLQIFDKAIGITIFNTSTLGAEALVLGGFLGSIIGIIASMFFAGWVASYLSRPYFFDRRIGALYGLLAWCLTLFVSMLFMTHMAFPSMEGRNYIANPNASVASVNTSQTASIIASETTKKSTSSENVTTGDMAVKKASLSQFLTFLLFFIGAASSCFGGYYGLIADKKMEATKL